MQLQSLTNVSLWLLTYLAGHKGVVPASELNKALGFSKQSFIVPVAKLKEKGYVSAVSGPFGGYSLCKRPEEISVLDILTLFDDELRLDNDKVPRASCCKAVDNLKGLLHKMDDDFEQTMSTYTLADLLKE